MWPYRRPWRLSRVTDNSEVTVNSELHTHVAPGIYSMEGIERLPEAFYSLIVRAFTLVSSV
jgi:hypothetical protein